MIDLACLARAFPEYVSPIVDGYVHASPAQRRQPRHAISEHNSTAQTLRTDCTGILALAFPDRSLPYVAGFALHVTVGRGGPQLHDPHCPARGARLTGAADRRGAGPRLGRPDLQPVRTRGRRDRGGVRGHRQCAHPAVTTVVLDKRQVLENAVDLLNSRLTGDRVARIRESLVDHTLVVRESSTGAAGAA